MGKWKELMDVHKQTLAAKYMQEFEKMPLEQKIKNTEKFLEDLKKQLARENEKQKKQIPQVTVPGIDINIVKKE